MTSWSWRLSNYTPVPVLSLAVPVLSLVVPVLSLVVPVLSLAVPVLSVAFIALFLFVGQHGSVAPLCSLSLAMVEVGSKLKIIWIKGRIGAD